jgi:hypothetical protein
MMILPYLVITRIPYYFTYSLIYLGPGLSQGQGLRRENNRGRELQGRRGYFLEKDMMIGRGIVT